LYVLSEWAEDYTFFCGEGNEDQQLGTGFLVHKGITSAVGRVEFIRDRMPDNSIKRPLVQYYYSECARPM
jgi:hypothetical protein